MGRYTIRRTEPSPIMEAALRREANTSALGLGLGAVAAACLTAFALVAQSLGLPEPSAHGVLPAGPPSALRQALTLLAPAAGPAVSSPSSPAATPAPSVAEPASPAPAAPVTAEPVATGGSEGGPSASPLPPVIGRPSATLPSLPADAVEADKPGHALGRRPAERGPGRKHPKKDPDGFSAQGRGPKADAGKGRGRPSHSRPGSRIQQSRSAGRSSSAAARGSGRAHSKSRGEGTSKSSKGNSSKEKGRKGSSRERNRSGGRD